MRENGKKNKQTESEKRSMNLNTKKYSNNNKKKENIYI